MRVESIFRPIVTFIMFLCAGCATHVVELSVSVGSLEDRSSGYFAYYTGLIQSQEKPWLLKATNAAITRVRMTAADQPFYPSIAYDPERVYVRPVSLGDLDTIPRTEFDRGEYLEIGYFMKRIGHGWDANLLVGADRVMGPSDGISWCGPTDELIERLPSLVEEFRSVAARFGAEGVVDFAIYKSPEATAYGGAGVFATARVIVRAGEPKSSRTAHPQ